MKLPDLLLAALSADEPQSVQQLTAALRSQGHLRNHGVRDAEIQVRTTLRRLAARKLVGKQGTVEGRPAPSPWGHEKKRHRVAAWVKK